MGPMLELHTGVKLILIFRLLNCLGDVSAFG